MNAIFYGVVGSMIAYLAVFFALFAYAQRLQRDMELKRKRDEEKTLARVRTNLNKYNRINKKEK